MNVSENIGHQTLDLISEQDAFNTWMYETISPYCRGRILEIGSGIGNLSELFLKDARAMTLSDISEDYCQILRDRFSRVSNLEGIINLPLGNFQIEQAYPELVGQFDTVFALNVLEHVPAEDDALQTMAAFLKPGGRILLLVPAYSWLYTSLDRSIDHIRRYTPRRLNRALERNGFDVQKTFSFNVSGILGWFVAGHILKKKQLPGGSMWLYNKLVPFHKRLDLLFRQKIGLSVISIGIKPK